MPYSPMPSKSYGSGSSTTFSSYLPPGSHINSMLLGRLDYSGGTYNGGGIYNPSRSPLYNLGSYSYSGYTPGGGSGIGSYSGYNSPYSSSSSSSSSGYMGSPVLSKKYGSGLPTISEHSSSPRISRPPKFNHIGLTPLSLSNVMNTSKGIRNNNRIAVWNTEDIDVTSPRRPSRDETDTITDTTTVETPATTSTTADPIEPESSSGTSGDELTGTATPGEITRGNASQNFGTIRRGRTVIRIQTQHLKENPYLANSNSNSTTSPFEKEKKPKKTAGEKMREKWAIQSKKKKHSGYRRPTLSEIRNQQEFIEREAAAAAQGLPSSPLDSADAIASNSSSKSSFTKSAEERDDAFFNNPDKIPRRKSTKKFLLLRTCSRDNIPMIPNSPEIQVPISPHISPSTSTAHESDKEKNDEQGDDGGGGGDGVIDFWANENLINRSQRSTLIIRSFFKPQNQNNFYSNTPSTSLHDSSEVESINEEDEENADADDLEIANIMSRNDTLKSPISAPHLISQLRKEEERQLKELQEIFDTSKPLEIADPSPNEEGDNEMGFDADETDIIGRSTTVKKKTVRKLSSSGIINNVKDDTNKILKKTEVKSKPKTVKKSADLKKLEDNNNKDKIKDKIPTEDEKKQQIAQDVKDKEKTKENVKEKTPLRQNKLKESPTPPEPQKGKITTTTTPEENKTNAGNLSSVLQKPKEKANKPPNLTLVENQKPLDKKKPEVFNRFIKDNKSQSPSPSPKSLTPTRKKFPEVPGKTDAVKDSESKILTPTPTKFPFKTDPEITKENKKTNELTSIPVKEKEKENVAKTPPSASPPQEKEKISEKVQAPAVKVKTFAKLEEEAKPKVDEKLPSSVSSPSPIKSPKGKVDVEERKSNPNSISNSTTSQLNSLNSSLTSTPSTPPTPSKTIDKVKALSKESDRVKSQTPPPVASTVEEKPKLPWKKDNVAKLGSPTPPRTPPPLKSKLLGNLNNQSSTDSNSSKSSDNKIGVKPPINTTSTSTPTPTSDPVLVKPTALKNKKPSSTPSTDSNDSPTSSKSGSRKNVFGLENRQKSKEEKRKSLENEAAGKQEDKIINVQIDKEEINSNTKKITNVDIVKNVEEKKTEIVVEKTSKSSSSLVEEVKVQTSESKLQVEVIKNKKEEKQEETIVSLVEEKHTTKTTSETSVTEENSTNTTITTATTTSNDVITEGEQQQQRQKEQCISVLPNPIVQEIIWGSKHSRSSQDSSGGSVDSASPPFTPKSSERDGSSTTSSSTLSAGTSGSSGRMPSPPSDSDDEPDTVPRRICPSKSRPKYRKYEVQDFQFLKVLGKGSFGKVLLAELRGTDCYFAVKCLKKDVVLEDDDVECTMIERKVLLMGSKHPYICDLLCTMQSESHLFFVMEYLNGGDLMWHIQNSGRFSEERARFYAAEILSGLKFLHKKGIIYRDLKLDNILLDFEGHIRIADFGMCKLQIYLDRTADTFCGTPDYMAPEIIKGLKYNQCVDFWAFGILLYEMLIGQSPFSGCDEDELFWSICNEAVRYPRYLSRESKLILERLLDKTASTRLGTSGCQYGDIKEQAFFATIDWDKLERREIEPPFKPKLKHSLDVQYFDTAFTKEAARLTPVDKEILRSMDQNQFLGFSYTNPHTTD